MVTSRREDCRAHCLHSAQPALRGTPKCGCRLCAPAHCEVLSLPGTSD
uniref:Uncharacterized protein MANES_01G247200 n=1 Tax=Rhizophora mucronata TaxID=61149 RepID=A0A2P2M8I5_RHIMU